MAFCGCTPRIFASTDGRATIRGSACRCRMCPFCAHRRARAGAERCHAAIAAMDSTRFLTLTLRHRHAPLHLELDRLFAAFKALRKLPAWKRHVTGGIYGVEAHPSADGVGWHVHLHALIDGAFWDHHDISKCWLQATGDSGIVCIKACNSRSAAAGYITKYCSKPASCRSWKPDQIVEFAIGMRGRRLLNTFGHLHGRSLDAAEKADTGPAGSVSVQADAFRAALDHGDPQAITAAQVLEHASPRIWRVLTDDGCHPHARSTAHPPYPADQLHRLLLPLSSSRRHGTDDAQLNLRQAPKPPPRTLHLWPLRE